MRKPSTDARFESVASAWVVPNAYPPPGSDVKDGTYSCYSSVAFDGDTENAPKAVMLGVKSEVTKEKEQLTQFAVPFYQQNNKVTPSPLEVKPGDLVCCFLWRGFRIIWDSTSPDIIEGIQKRIRLSGSPHFPVVCARSSHEDRYCQCGCVHRIY